MIIIRLVGSDGRSTANVELAGLTEATYLQISDLLAAEIRADSFSVSLFFGRETPAPRDRDSRSAVAIVNFISLAAYSRATTVS